MKPGVSLVGDTSVARSHAPVSAWLRRRLAALLEPAGVTLDGPNPWDPQIRRTRTFGRILRHGSLGAGDSYVDGDWECAALDELTARLLAAGVDGTLARRGPAAFRDMLVARFVDGHTRARSSADIQSHYDVGNALYRAMLGPTMTYSCGYWAGAATLEEAQDAKHELICRKLGLAPGMRVLDIGCGWGGFAAYAARHHGVHVTGITLSPAQAAFARERTQDLSCHIRLVDYRDVDGLFDRILSVGMFEHVGPPNYAQYFDTVARCLVPDGLFLLHTIGGLTSETTSDPWITRHVFPGTVLPSAAQITRAIEGRFTLEDWHNFGADYDRTLMAWYHALDAAWPSLAHAELRHGTRADGLTAADTDRLYRTWRYYLLTCAGTFRARRNQLWQLVLSPRGVDGGYRRAS